MNKIKRNPAADILRILALFFVISVHFLLNNGFYDQTVAGKRMLVMVLMRALFIICVPLFLTLSGYLLRKKQLSKQYYKRIGTILVTYLLSCAACIIYSVCVLHSSMSFKDMIFKTLNFSAAPYSWYIEMYLGLFFLIPFLNIAYNNIPSKKWKIVLILSFILLTSLPSVVNVYNWVSEGWWKMPASDSTKYKLIPAWWENLYPITYYFIGCYLSEYGLKIKKRLNILLVVVCVILSGLYSYWRSYSTYFIWGSWCDYESLFNVILTTLVFTLFININYEKISEKLSLCLQKISGLCLGAYLVSWIFDKTFYPILIEKVPETTRSLEYYFLIVPAVFVLSLLLSYIMSKIQLLLGKGCYYFARLFSKKENK